MSLLLLLLIYREHHDRRSRGNGVENATSDGRLNEEEQRSLEMYTSYTRKTPLAGLEKSHSSRGGTGLVCEPQ